MLRVPDQSPGPIHHEWTPAELVRTNDVVLLSVIEALLTDAHIQYLVTDRNVSVVAACPNKFDDTGYTQSGTAYKSATPCGTTLITGEREALFSINRAIPKSC